MAAFGKNIDANICGDPRLDIIKLYSETTKGKSPFFTLKVCLDGSDKCVEIVRQNGFATDFYIGKDAAGKDALIVKVARGGLSQKLLTFSFDTIRPLLGCGQPIS